MKKVATVGVSHCPLDDFFRAKETEFDELLNNRLKRHADQGVEIIDVYTHLSSEHITKLATITWDEPPEKLCPTCEVGEVAEGDYLCKNCR